MSKGLKFDDEKRRFDLLPLDAIGDVVDVFTFGAKKYDDENWRYVEHHERRYFSAAMRHMHAWRSGEDLDPETGKPHLAHAICCLLMLHARAIGDRLPRWIK